MQQATQPPELPTLDSGVHLLESDDHPRAAIHALVLDHLLMHDGEVYWLDSDNSATAHPLLRLAPNERILERVHVARAQTSTQHYSLVDRLTELVDDDTSLLVTTGYDHFYRDHERGHESAKDMQVRTLAMTAGAARDHDLPLLLTRRQADEFSEPLRNAAQEVLTYEETQWGPRFVGEDFETLVYPTRDGFQTTITYWQRILEARHPDKVEASSGVEGGIRH